MKNQYYNFSEEELRTLLEQSKQGDDKAFNHLSSIIRTISHSYFKSKFNYGKLSSADDADDLANDIFISFAKQYREINSIEKWLRRVLFLVFVNYYKKQKTRSFTEFDESFFGEDDSQEDRIDSQKIAEILPQLKPPKDEIIRMRFWEGLKFAEIAEKLNKNEASIKKMFYRTLEEIKNKLK